MGWSSVRYLEELAKRGWPHTISPENVGDVACLKIEFDLASEPYTPGRETRDELTMWVAPQVAFSVIKRCGGTKIVPEDETDLGDITTFDTYEIFEGLYAESETHPGVWLMTEVHITQVDWHADERLWVTFSDVQIGIDVPDSTFTFAGMGMPEGTVVTDRRVRGEPVRLIYGEDAIEELLEINAPAP